ncbi:MAG TPA: hypothetical protein ENF73_04770 [Proteobacteria bacterium]|nr:hypothetical protein [Pseudomonadota bacterium]
MGKVRWRWMLALLLLGLALGLLLSSCGGGGDDDSGDDDDAADDDTGDDDTGDDDWGDWWPPEEGLTVVYDVQEWTGAHYDAEVKVLGDDEFNGETYTKIEMGDFEAQDIMGFHGWFDFSTPGEIGFAGAEIYWWNAKDDTEPDGIFNLDEPVYIFVNRTLNEPKTDSADGTWTIWGNPTSFHVELTSETVDLDATVTVPYGTVEHCVRVDVDIHEEFGDYPDFDGNASFYFHKELGFVKIEGANLMGFSLQLKEFREE